VFNRLNKMGSVPTMEVPRPCKDRLVAHAYRSRWTNPPGDVEVDPSHVEDSGNAVRAPCPPSGLNSIGIGPQRFGGPVHALLCPHATSATPVASARRGRRNARSTPGLTKLQRQREGRI
jgi:hypothetical protein